MRDLSQVLEHEGPLPYPSQDQLQWLLEAVIAADSSARRGG
jgi:hypothetical protein